MFSRVYEINFFDMYKQKNKKAKDEIGIIFEGKSVDYLSFEKKVEKIRKGLKENGVPKASIIGCLLERNDNIIYSFFGIFAADCAYLPIDTKLPDSRREYMISDSGVKYILTDYRNKRKFDHTIQLCEGIYLAVQGKSNSLIEPELAYLMYTSGTTGLPKGTMITKVALQNFLETLEKSLDFSNYKTLLAATTMSFDISILELIAPIIFGIKIILASEAEQQDPVALGNLIVNYHVDLLQMTPTRIKNFYFSNEAEMSLHTLSCILVGGEAFPKDLLLKLQLVPGLRLFNMYGPTETTIWSTYMELTNENEISIGSPFLNTGIHIVSENNEIAGIDEIGEICISGLGLSKGYINKKEETDKRFVNLEALPELRIYRTGDLGKYAVDGKLYCLGRNDSQVKVNGHRIELQEIENRLLEVDEISHAVVLKQSNQGIDKLVAYVVANNELASKAIKAFLSDYLPNYMIPNEIIFVDEVPTNANGKIDRKNLAENLKYDQSDKCQIIDTVKIVAGIWSEILGKKVETNVNFKEAGGSSMELAKMAAMLSDKFDLKITVINLLEFTTIETIANYFNERKAK